MEIEPIGINRISGIDQASRRHADLIGASEKTKEVRTKIAQQPATIDAAPSTTDTINQESTSDDAKASGVIRLLEAGHFSGVAEVRLRINFFEELSARSTEREAAEIADQSQELAASIGSEVDDFVSALAIDEKDRESLTALVDQFNTAVQSATSSSTTDGPLDANTITGELEAAFTTFVSRVRELFATEEAETQPTDATKPAEDDTVVGSFSSRDAPAADLALQPIEGRIEVGSESIAAIGISETEPTVETAEPIGGETALSLDDALASLTQAFQDALVSFISWIEETSLLPELSEPFGSGSAYNKFLANYNDLLGVTASVDEQA